MHERFWINILPQKSRGKLNVSWCFLLSHSGCIFPFVNAGITCIAAHWSLLNIRSCPLFIFSKHNKLIILICCGNFQLIFAFFPRYLPFTSHLKEVTTEQSEVVVASFRSRLIYPQAFEELEENVHCSFTPCW